MSNLSLTARMSLLFMTAIMAVLAVTGALVHRMSEHHFQTMDHHALQEKLEATTHILQQLSTRERFTAIEPQLSALLSGHRDLEAAIYTRDGDLLFKTPGATSFPDIPYPESNSPIESSWEQSGHFYQGLRATVAGGGANPALLVTLTLDVTQHQPFLEQLWRWFWSGLAISAVLSAALGWAVARSGLRPLRQVTAVATSISARSLKERIPIESIPTDLKPLAAAFNAMLERLDEAFARLSDFSADIAHELRTPVSNLMTHTEVTLSRKRDVISYEENLHSNLEELKRMSRMIDDMLFLAKSDNGLITPLQQEIALEQVVQQLLDYYEPVAAERNITLRLSGAGSLRGDVLMLRRALSNLLSNALRFTPEEGAIDVMIAQSPHSILVTVENPGEPITDDQLSKLFDRFYRGDPSRREGDSTNAGLGLAITRSIVAAHGGEITCISERQRTRFQLTFPAAITGHESHS